MVHPDHLPASKGSAFGIGSRHSVRDGLEILDKARHGENRSKEIDSLRCSEGELETIRVAVRRAADSPFIVDWVRTEIVASAIPIPITAKSPLTAISS
jgi:hypothetical protein